MGEADRPNAAGTDKLYQRMVQACYEIIPESSSSAPRVRVKQPWPDNWLVCWEGRISNLMHSTGDRGGARNRILRNGSETLFGKKRGSLTETTWKSAISSGSGPARSSGSTTRFRSFLPGHSSERSTVSSQKSFYSMVITNHSGGHSSPVTVFPGGSSERTGKDVANIPSYLPSQATAIWRYLN